MSFIVPPAPSQEEAADVVARLARAASKQPEEKSKHEHRSGSRFPVVLACALSISGMLMLACALAVICAPQSQLALLVLRVCEAIL